LSRFQAQDNPSARSAAIALEAPHGRGCPSQPFAFPSDHSRFLYFRTAGRDPDDLAHEDLAAEVALLSGLPGAGKDR
jgi:hypothetical protein